MAVLIDTSVFVAVEEDRLRLADLIVPEGRYALSVVTAAALLHGVHRDSGPSAGRRAAFVEGILAGFGVILAGGAFFVASRAKQDGPPTPAAATAMAPRPELPRAAPIAAAPTDKTAMLLEGLKDELFQLEVEKQQGRISEADYEAAKAALNQTLKRALARKA